MSTLRLCSICSMKAKRASCCNALLCAKDSCASSHARVCTASKALLAADPKAWRKANAPEERTTTELIDALNAKVPGFFWRTKRRQGSRRSDENDGVLDVSGFAAPDGVGVYVETKNDHLDSCACKSCASQRDFALKVNGAGGIAILGIRDAARGVRAVQERLAARRASPSSLESSSSSSTHAPSAEAVHGLGGAQGRE